MIRYSEAVLPGHPDKLCDHVAERLVEATMALDPEGYCQFEAGIWCEHLWLSGGYAVRGPAGVDVERVATAALDEILDAVHSCSLSRDRRARVGVRALSPTPRRQWQITNTVCRYDADPTQWSRHINDQAICIGWAGYDAKVNFLPPEHWLVLQFRDALWQACCGGDLARCGPDGKLLVTMREDDEGFYLEHVLVTLEHPETLTVLELAERVSCVLATHYTKLQRRDRRWRAKWPAVELLVNPNGPLSNAGSLKDNGQTGRKLVMDYYGPRVPIGGGAIYGKHPTHVDRLGAARARQQAIEAVRRGERECLVHATYAPGITKPIGNNSSHAVHEWA